MPKRRTEKHLRDVIPLHSRPEPPDPLKVAQIARITPLVRSLEQTLQELVKQDEGRKKRSRGKDDYDVDDDDDDGDDDDDYDDQDSVDSNASSVDNDSISKRTKLENRIPFNHHISQSILRRLDDAISSHSWHPLQPPPQSLSSPQSPKTQSLSQPPSDTKVSSTNTTKAIDESRATTSKTVPKHTTSIMNHENNVAPAGLLQGTVEYYNKFGGQWRIVISNATIRPRVNLETGKQRIKAFYKQPSFSKEANSSNTNTTPTTTTTTPTTPNPNPSKYIHAFWKRSVDALQDDNPDQNQTLVLGGKVQILAFDDNES